MIHHTAYLPLLVAASALAQAAPTPTPAWTQTSNYALATDYVFRGISQIDSSSALAFSGGTDVTHASGFAFGVWFANQNVNAVSGNDTMEADVYASYTFKVKGADVSVGLLTYNYPGASAFNTIEGNIGASLSGLSLKYSYAFTEYFSATGSDGTSYLDLAYTYAYGDLAVGLHYGWTFGSGSQLNYEDYKVSLSYPVLGFTASVAYTDANLGLPAVYPNKTLDKGLIVFSISKSL